MIKLTEQQIKYLNIFNGLKSAYRQAELNKQLGTDLQKTIESELISLNILKKTKSGALKSVYDYHGLNDLINLNTKTIDDLLNDLRNCEENLQSKIAQDKRLTETDPNYCFYSRDVQSSIAYNRDKYLRLKNRINLKEQFNKKFNLGE